jgi:hypothetical protein
MMAEQNPPDRLSVDQELQMVLDEPGGSTLPLELRADGMLLYLLEDPLIMVPSPVDQALRAS